MHHLFLVLLHSRHVVYLTCAILFTFSAVSLGFQPYFHETYPKILCFALMALSVLAGLSYTSFIKRFGPHKNLR